MVSVIASSVRKGNVIEKEGKLYLVLTAENIHPGKGTPVTHLEMRRISDGVKTVERLRTTDSIEKAFVEHQNLQLSLPGRRQYVFMQPETFDQVHGRAGCDRRQGPLSDRKHGSAAADCSKATPSPSKFPSAPPSRWWRPSR